MEAKGLALTNGTREMSSKKDVCHMWFEFNECSIAEQVDQEEGETRNDWMARGIVEGISFQTTNEKTKEAE